MGTGCFPLDQHRSLEAAGGTEKATSYYLQNHVFIGKMTLLAIVLVLEFWPMAALIRWRRRTAKGERPDTRSAPLYARISFAQAGLIVLMVLAATAMARGYGV